MNTPRMPERGTPVLDGILSTLKQICDFLPTLVVNGDGKTTSVTRSRYGTIVRANQQQIGAAPMALSSESSEYNGPWALTDVVDENTHTVTVKQGLLNRNGYYFRPFNDDQTIVIDMPSTSETYIAIRQGWETTTRKWENAELIATNNFNPWPGGAVTKVYGYVVLGILLNLAQPNEPVDYRYIGINNPLPCMFVTGKNYINDWEQPNE